MKPGRQKPLLVLSCGAMEITWRYAWVFFLTLLILDHSWPLPETLAVFTMASLITVLTGHKSWRMYQTLAGILSAQRRMYKNSLISDHSQNPFINLIISFN